MAYHSPGSLGPWFAGPTVMGSVLTFGLLPDDTTYNVFVFDNEDETDPENAVASRLGIPGMGFRLPAGLSPQQSAHPFRMSLTEFDLDYGTYFVRVGAVAPKFAFGDSDEYWGVDSPLTDPIEFVVSAGVEFTDIDDLAAHVIPEITTAAARGIVFGRGGTIFDPEANVTVQEAATMFLRSVGLPVEFEYALTMAGQQLIWDAEADADAVMTRVETAEMIANTMRLLLVAPELTTAQVDSILANFTDVGDLNAEQRLNLAICVQLGIWQGFGDGRIGPHDVLQRAHVASSVVRMQNILF